MAIFNNALHNNYGTYNHKLHMLSVLLHQENTLDMQFGAVGAVVVVLRVVEDSGISPYKIPIQNSV